MYLILLAASVLLITLVGWPIAHLALADRLRKYALGLAPTFGFAYIVFVSYVCFRLNLPGSAYAVPIALPPIVLLILLMGAGRIRITGQDGVAIALYLFSLFVFAQLFLLPDGRALSLSLGNLDIVEYASEARYLQEFPRDTTVGVLGEYSMARMIDTMWASPALLCSFLSSLLGAAPYQLQSIALQVVAAQGAAMVWLIANEGLALRRTVSIGVSVLYAVNPIIMYMLWQGFGAQAQSMPLVLGAVAFFMTTMKEPGTWVARLRASAPLLIMLSGLLLTYHFMLPITLLLLASYLLVLAVRRLSIGDFVSGLAVLIVVTLATLALNPLRVLAMATVLETLWTGDSGWFVPWISPAEQLGFGAAAVTTQADPPAWVIIFGLAVAAILATLTLVDLITRRDPERLAFVIGLCVPTLLVGYAFAVIGEEGGVLGSYRSFKITSSFVPFVLLALAIGLCGAGWTRWRAVQLGAMGAFAVVFVVGVHGAGAYLWRAKNTVYGYVMPPDFPNIQSLETMPLSGVNFKDSPENFDLFWAHYFTMKKRQVFERFPYGRPVREFDQPYTIVPASSKMLGAEVDIFHVDALSGAEPIALNSRFNLLKANHVLALKISPGDGWWGKEAIHRWTGSTGRRAEVLVDNGGQPVRVRVVGKFAQLRPGDAVTVLVGGVPIETQLTQDGIETVSFVVPTGNSKITLETMLDPWQAPAPDPRTVGVMWYELRLIPES